MSEIIQILMERDGISREEAEDHLQVARTMVRRGTDPEEVLYEEFGLEPDYVWELL